MLVVRHNRPGRMVFGAFMPNGCRKKGDFGNTKGNALDALSNLLAAAALIPGIDSFIDLASIPVDLLRGDFISAGLDAAGIIPILGEAADTARLARLTNNTIDAARAANRSSKGTKLLSKVSNPKLTNTIKEIYRPGAKVGDGGLADAIRHEIKTGNLVGGKSHIKKGMERLKNLERISSKESLSKQEKNIAEALINDLKQALEGK